MEKKITFVQWCQFHKLPEDRKSLKIYQDWLVETPSIQEIISNIQEGRYQDAVNQLTQLISA